MSILNVDKIQPIGGGVANLSNRFLFPETA